MKCRALAAVVAAFAGSTAGGQTINIDFGGGAGAPPADFAAAGTPGVWNLVEPEPETPAPLVDVTGTPVAATVTVHPFVPSFTLDDPATSDPEALLMDDVLPGLGDVVVSLCFDALRNGTYELLTYAWVPAAPEQGSTIFVGSVEQWNGQIVAGPWPGAFEPGVTHAVHEATVTDGTLEVSMVGSAWWTSGALNGIQLRHLEDLPGDANHDGFVDVSDIIIVILDWTTAGHGCDGVKACPGDLNHDQTVDVLDLIMVITSWTG